MAAARAARVLRKAEGFGEFDAALGRELQALALYALDLNQLTKLAKAIGKARSDGKSLDPLSRFGWRCSATRRSI